MKIQSDDGTDTSLIAHRLTSLSSVRKEGRKEERRSGKRIDCRSGEGRTEGGDLEGDRILRIGLKIRRSIGKRRIHVSAVYLK